MHIQKIQRIYTKDVLYEGGETSSLKVLASYIAPLNRSLYLQTLQSPSRNARLRFRTGAENSSLRSAKLDYATVLGREARTQTSNLCPLPILGSSNPRPVPSSYVSSPPGPATVLDLDFRTVMAKLIVPGLKDYPLATSSVKRTVSVAHILGKLLRSWCTP